MALYKYLRQHWQSDSNELQRQRMIKWRSEPVTLKIEYPTRLDRARSLGYKAKEGLFIVRQRVPRGGHRKPFPSGGRRSAKWTTRKSLMLNYRTIAEQRVADHYTNCEVLNSYEVGKDGQSAWFEVIMVDVAHPAIKSDPHYSWLVNMKGRPFRGLTSAGKKSRGLRHKGMGTEHLRPSRTANKKRRLRKDLQ
ncbi:MAG: 50S ribosomal protein L15e [Nanoarchaeota archaeon]